MKTYQLFFGESKEAAAGIGGIVMTDDMSLGIASPPLDECIKQRKKCFVNLENLQGKLTEIVEFEMVFLPPFHHQIPPYVYRIKLG